MFDAFASPYSYPIAAMKILASPAANLCPAKLKAVWPSANCRPFSKRPSAIYTWIQATPTSLLANVVVESEVIVAATSLGQGGHLLPSLCSSASAAATIASRECVLQPNILCPIPEVDGQTHNRDQRNSNEHASCSPNVTSKHNCEKHQDWMRFPHQSILI